MKQNKHKATLVAVLVFIGLLITASGQAEQYYVGSQSKQVLERLSQDNPQYYALNYYLGLIYLNQQQDQKAVSAWEKYLAYAPDDAKSVAVREKITVLKINSAENYAKNVIHQDEASLEKKIGPNTVAVLDFNALDNEELSLIGKGLTAMVITDLSKIPEIKVVEREKVSALMREIKLSQTGLIDDQTARKTGKFLLAEKIVRGIMDVENKTDINVSSLITDTVTAEDIGQVKTQGSLDNMFVLEKKMVHQILKELGIKTSSLDPTVQSQIDAYHTRHLDALLSYSKGLELQDNHQFIRARQSFQKAISLDPKFKMARQAFKAVPTQESFRQVGRSDAFVDVDVEESSTEKDNESTGEKTSDIVSSTQVDLSTSDEIINIAQDDNTIAPEVPKSQLDFSW